MSHGTAGLRVERAASRWPRLSAPLVMVVLWLLLVAVHEAIVPAQLGENLCVFRAVTGTPCPTCGTTRLCLAAVRGDVLAALRFNPLMFVVLVLLLALLVLRVGLRRVVRVDLTVRQQLVVVAIGLAVLALNWAWVAWYHAADGAV